MKIEETYEITKSDIRYKDKMLSLPLELLLVNLKILYFILVKLILPKKKILTERIQSASTMI